MVGHDRRRRLRRRSQIGRPALDSRANAVSARTCRVFAWSPESQARAAQRIAREARMPGEAYALPGELKPAA
jgi:hypothetical protein